MHNFGSKMQLFGSIVPYICIYIYIYVGVSVSSRITSLLHQLLRIFGSKMPLFGSIVPYIYIYIYIYIYVGVSTSFRTTSLLHQLLRILPVGGCPEGLGIPLHNPFKNSAKKWHPHHEHLKSPVKHKESPRVLDMIFIHFLSEKLIQE